MAPGAPDRPDMGRDRRGDHPDAAAAAPRLSIVLPAYNEGHHIRANLRRIGEVLAGSGHRPFELIVVDDGSGDGTADEARRAAEGGLPVRVARHPANAGKGAALLTGARLARGDVVAFLDADLEIGPDQLVRLADVMADGGTDVVVGVRAGAAEGGGRDFPLARRLMSRAYRWLVHALFDLPMATQTGLKLFRREALAACLPRLRAERFAFDVEILTACQRLGYRIVACPVTVDYRRGGRLGRVTPRQLAGMLGETMAIYYRASFWCWLQPGAATRVWMAVLGVGIVLFGIGIGKLVTPLVLAPAVKPIFYVVALQFLRRDVRDWLLVLGGGGASLVALAVLNKRILAAFARRDGGDLAGIWRWAPPESLAAGAQDLLAPQPDSVASHSELVAPHPHSVAPSPPDPAAPSPDPLSSRSPVRGAEVADGPTLDR